MARVKVKVNAGVSVPMLGEAFEEFTQEKFVMGSSEKTIRNYEDTFKLFCRFNDLDYHTEVSEITSSHVYKWMQTMNLEGKKPSTINHYIRDIKVFLKWCMDEDRRYIPYFKITQMKSQEEELKMFTDEEMMALLRKPARNSSFMEWRAWAVVNFCYATGARAASVVSVVIGNLDFQRKEIRFPHTKNKKALTVPMSPALETAMKEYIRVCRSEEPQESYLFCNVSNEALTTHALQQAFAKYCNDRGVTRTNIHGLRHNFAKGWVRAGGDVFRLQQILGHSSLDMTRRYVRLFSEDLKESFEMYNPLDTMKKATRRTQVVKTRDI